MILDVIVVVILLASALIAFLRGFIREVLTVFGVVGGLAAAYGGGPLLKPVFESWLVDPAAAEPQKLFGILPYDLLCEALAYGVIFLSVVIVLSIVSHLLAGWAKKLGLGAIDRTLGVIFGLARGVVILIFLYLVPFLLFPKDERAGWFENSRSLAYMESMTGWAASLLPENFTKDKDEDAPIEGEETSANNASSSSSAPTAIEKLEALDVLRREFIDSPATTEGDPAASGYNPQERMDINRLIESEINDNAIAPTTITPQNTQPQNGNNPNEFNGNE
jgi:membrane protein required for colicin V production